ncbi:hypothetical protein BGZ96_009920 [Linnemannia gamsii]|uniref:Kelch repeat protein n=1 Tax=Linnemannia gamsii TaxID=64522 RepID=A0ABQ7JVA5_9FUNG|nr:hypothetical protein BGZ96_009920 [Linnemannia gamsii]
MVSSSWLLSLATAVFLTAGDLHLIQKVSAQQGNPAGAAEMAYASVPERTLYMQGGYNTNYTDVFYALDLTQDTWLVSSPPWKQLIPPSIRGDRNPKTTIANGMTVTKNQTQLIIWAEPGIFVYDIAAGTWQNKTMDSLTEFAPLWFNFRRAATHGETGLVYIPGGASAGEIPGGAPAGEIPGGASAGAAKMVVFDPETFEARTVDMPPSNLLIGTVSLYGWIWSDIRKSFLFTCGEFVNQGGGFTGQNSDKSFEYFPGNNTWAPLVTNGVRLPAISRHCMVEGYGGKKMVLYGGHEWVMGKEVLQGKIYVLDVLSMTWSSGESISPNLVSADSACTITGTKFISWGGSAAQMNKDILSTPAIFDIETMKWTWTSQFKKQISATESTSPSSPSSPSSDSKGNSNTVAITAGCGGAVVVLGLVGLVFWMRQRHKKVTYASVAAAANSANTVGGVVDPTRPRRSPNTYSGNPNILQDFYNKDLQGAEGISGAYGDYQNMYGSPFNVQGPPTVHATPDRNPRHAAGGDKYHEFPNDNIQRNPQTMPDTFY